MVVEPQEALKNNLVPRGLELRTLRLLAVRSNQLSYEILAGYLKTFGDPHVRHGR